jgi:hypothetical protein
MLVYSLKGVSMSKKEVLLELLDDNRRRIHLLLEEKETDFLYWSPDGEANNIAVTLWHAARVHDVFLVQHILGKPAEDEVWIQSGWAEKADYDPRGLGTNGWGMVTGYSPEEVSRIPRMSPDLLLGYFDEIAACLRVYLEETSEELLQQDSIGFEGKQSNYFWIRHPLFDLTRHVGEMLAIKAMWDRRLRA